MQPKKSSSISSCNYVVIHSFTPIVFGICTFFGEELETIAIQNGWNAYL